MEVTGKIKLVRDEQVITEKFKKRELVVTTPGDYPQDLLIQFTQDKCAVLDHYSEGDEVEISVNLRGREWVNPEGQSKYFNTIEGWRIRKTDENDDLPY